MGFRSRRRKTFTRVLGDPDLAKRSASSERDDIAWRAVKNVGIDRVRNFPGLIVLAVAECKGVGCGSSGVRPEHLAQAELWMIPAAEEVKLRGELEALGRKAVYHRRDEVFEAVLVGLHRDGFKTAERTCADDPHRVLESRLVARRDGACRDPERALGITAGVAPDLG